MKNSQHAKHQRCALRAANWCRTHAHAHNNTERISIKASQRAISQSIYTRHYSSLHNQQHRAVLITFCQVLLISVLVSCWLTTIPRAVHWMQQYRRYKQCICMQRYKQ